MRKDITVIGNATVDVLAKPVNAKVFETGSQPMENIKLSLLVRQHPVPWNAWVLPMV